MFSNNVYNQLYAALFFKCHAVEKMQRAVLVDAASGARVTWNNHENTMNVILEIAVWLIGQRAHPVSNLCTAVNGKMGRDFTALGKL